MHTYGPDAAVTFTEGGWRVEKRKATPSEQPLLGVVSVLVDALKEGSKPDDMVSFDADLGWITLA